LITTRTYLERELDSSFHLGTIRLEDSDGFNTVVLLCGVDSDGVGGLLFRDHGEREVDERGEGREVYTTTLAASACSDALPSWALESWRLECLFPGSDHQLISEAIT
jgi:hypothetical protein